jgi:hypothetical protein
VVINYWELLIIGEVSTVDRKELVDIFLILDGKYV